VNARVFAQALGDATRAAIYWEKCPVLEKGPKGGCYGSTTFRIVAPRRSWREIFLGKTEKEQKERKEEVYR
jgi:hypothetical protein